MKIELLDQGFIELVDTLGSDLTIVNSARVSFGKRKHELDESDTKLLKYLARNAHYSPFRHVSVQLHIKWPLYVANQAYKHVVGISATSDSHVIDHAWNQISGRYVEQRDIQSRAAGEFRKQHESNKQASAGPIESPIEQALLAMRRRELIETIERHYEFELQHGVAKEQAREILPQCMYTEVWWTASFQALAHFVALRDKPEAQCEIQQYAKAIAEILQEKFPIAYEAWNENNT